MRHKKIKGEITIFLSLLLLVLLSLIFVTMESARQHAVRAHTAGMTDVGGYSILAQYHKELLEIYDVFFYDAGYRSSDLEIESVEQTIRSYLEEQSQEAGQLAFLKAVNRECHIKDYTLASDQKGAPFYNQAVLYMEETFGLSLAQSVLEMLLDSDGYEELQQGYLETEENNEKELTSLNEDKEKDVEEMADAEEPWEPDVEDPREQIQSVKKMGILSLALKNPDNVSAKKMNTANTVSQRQLQQGNGITEAENNSTMTGQVLFQEYILEKCSSYTKVLKDQELSYQVEYILSGKDSDAENLKSVIHSILMIREGCNFAYLMGDAGKKAEAYGLAAALTAGFAVPGLTKATQIALLLAWAYAESIMDVRVLTEGGKVPFLKTASTWQLSLDKLGNLLGELNTSEEKNSSGLGYTDYLRILLFAEKQEVMTLRCMDVVEIEVRKRTGDAGFALDHCIDRFTVVTEWETGGLFYGGNQSFHYVNESYFYY